MKTALITGITGQDGSFLAELLIEKGYEVHGIMRRSSSFNTGRIEHLYLDEWVRDMKQSRLINLHWGDMTDSSSLIRIIQAVQPDEIYNLAAQSHVKVSFDVPEYTAEADAVGTLRILEAVRILGLEKKTRLYQASTSELFGLVQEVPQRETTPFYPRSPYGVAKQYGFWITKNYRESYGMFAVNGILFNHESERRGETFVTRKITLAAARIAQGFQDKLYLGNLNALRDWGYAKDYVECMWLMLQHDTPEDFVIATGEYHSVREFCTLAFREAGIELRWEGQGIEEKGIDVQTGRTLVEVDPKYFRPAEVEQLLGDPTKAKTLLGWNPQQTSFEELVRKETWPLQSFSLSLTSLLTARQKQGNTFCTFNNYPLLKIRLIQIDNVLFFLLFDCNNAINNICHLRARDRVLIESRRIILPERQRISGLRLSGSIPDSIFPNSNSAAR